jgi:hypothetical protein
MRCSASFAQASPVRPQASHDARRHHGRRLWTFNGTSSPPFSADIATEPGCSEGAARAAVPRLRARYRTLHRREVARTLDDPDAVDEEIRELSATFSSSRRPAEVGPVSPPRSEDP